MVKDNQHRLLKRQLKKANFSDEEIARFSEFLVSVDKAYKASDSHRKHLENILEQSSQELFVANKKLREDVENKELEINKTKVQLNRIVDNVQDVIFQADVEGNYTYLNSAWEEKTGFKVEDTLGRHFTEFLKFVDKNDFEDVMNIQDVGENSFNHTFRINRKGKTLWFQATVQYVTGPDGKPEGYTGSFKDITSLKETELELIEANKVKDNFLSAMSHEIRTPLNAVIGMSNMLLMDDPKPEQLENLNALKFSSKHLLNLINDILDLSKLRAGKIQKVSEQFDILKTLQGLKKSFAFTAEDKHLEFNLNIDAGIPKYLLGDELRFSQIMTNLIGNAIKFTKEGSVSVDCNLVKREGDVCQIEFKITDTGIGIAPENQKRIFDQFTQAENHTTKRFGGTGLGLAISKGLLELFDSQLELSSELGVGSCFSFEINFEAAKKSEKDVQQKKALIGDKVKGLRVLVVEDNVMNVMVLKNFFSKWGVEHEEAENGQIGLDKLAHSDFDVILMDLQMPVMDGITAAKSIRANPEAKFQKIPIIALSASVSSDVVERVTSAGMNDYLSKPFNPEDLQEKLVKHTSTTLEV